MFLNYSRVSWPGRRQHLQKQNNLYTLHALLICLLESLVGIIKRFLFFRFHLSIIGRLCRFPLRFLFFLSENYEFLYLSSAI